MTATVRVQDAVCDAGVVARWRRHVMLAPGSECLWWVGAISSRSGHGRFWIGDRRVVIAHRFGYLLAHGPDALDGHTADGRAVLLAHTCDNTLCQNPDHVRPATTAQNAHEAAAHRGRLGSPLRDLRGPRGRAVAARAALLAGDDLGAALTAGMGVLDRDQLALF